MDMLRLRRENMNYVFYNIRTIFVRAHNTYVCVAITIFITQTSNRTSFPSLLQGHLIQVHSFVM